MEFQDINSNPIIKASQNRLELNAWLDRIIWANYLSGFIWAELRNWLNINKEDFKDSENSDVLPNFLINQLELVLEGLVEMINKAYKMAQPDLVGRNSLEYVLRKETGTDSNEKAGKFQILPDSLRKYISI